MFVALKGGRQRGYLLALVFFILQLQIEVLIFKQRKYFTVFLLCGCRSYLASFSSSAIRMVIKLFKVSLKIFENHKPIKSLLFYSCFAHSFIISSPPYSRFLLPAMIIYSGR